MIRQTQSIYVILKSPISIKESMTIEVRAQVMRDKFEIALTMIFDKHYILFISFSIIF